MADITSTGLSLNDGQDITWNVEDKATRTFDFDQADEKIVLLVWNNETDNAENCVVEVEAGDFFQEGYGDLTHDAVGEDEIAALIFDSAVVKDEDGEVTVNLYQSDGSTDYGEGAEALTNIKIGVLNL